MSGSRLHSALPNSKRQNQSTFEHCLPADGAVRSWLAVFVELASLAQRGSSETVQQRSPQFPSPAFNVDQLRGDGSGLRQNQDV